MIEIDDILDTENYTEDLDAVIFDLDDTLYSEKDYVRSGYRKIAEFFGKPEMTDQMWAEFERGGKAIDIVLETHGLGDKKKAALRVYRFQMPDIQMYPEVAEMLVRIRKTKKVGIITDGRPEAQRAKLCALKIQVDEIIVTDELGGAAFRKPCDVAFRLMQEKLKVPFEKMAYVGDNQKKDFVAPEKLGMRCIFFKNPDGIYSGR